MIQHLLSEIDLQSVSTCDSKQALVVIHPACSADCQLLTAWQPTLRCSSPLFCASEGFCTHSELHFIPTVFLLYREHRESQQCCKCIYSFFLLRSKLRVYVCSRLVRELDVSTVARAQVTRQNSD